MPGESPTKWQAQAYRFGVRRLESAVASGDPLLRGDPTRRRLNLALIISVVIAALVLGAFAVYGFVRPAPSIGAAQVVIDTDTGGTFVARNGRLYPAMNYASALLAAARGQGNGKPPTVASVDDAAVGTRPRGPLLGIPGAPNVLPRPSSLVPPAWTVCDDTTLDPSLPPGGKPMTTTTAIIGERSPVFGELSGRAMLVSADGGATTYLLWSGGRSKIDLSDNTIRLALDLPAGTAPRPISAALLDVIPQGDDLVPPRIDAAGTTPAYAQKLGVHVGDVFALQRADRSRAIYVALSHGVEPVSPLVGDLIRDQFGADKQLPLVAPALLRDAPRVDQLDQSGYPTTRPAILGYRQFPVACVYRAGTSESSTRVYALARLPLPHAAKPVSVTKPGSLVVDDVYVRPGGGAVLSAATDTQPAGVRSLYVVTDVGVAYPVVDPAALVALGYTGKDVASTSPELLALLPAGPALDPDAAAHFYPQTGAAAGSLPSPTDSAAAGAG